MTDELLALLEAGPEILAQLAAWLDQSEAAVHTLLKALARDGLAQKLTDGRYALAGYVDPAPPPPPKGEICLCEVCDQEFERKVGTSGRFCTRACYLKAKSKKFGLPEPARLKPDPTPPVSDTRTIVVDGVEYEAISVGSRPVTRDWPERKGGSSLSELGFSVDRS